MEICMNFGIIRVIETFRKPKGDNFYFTDSYVLQINKIMTLERLEVAK